MKFLKNTIKKLKKYFTFTILIALSLAVIILLSAFLYRVVISPPVDSSIDENIKRNNSTEVIQVNVLNACGTQGIADKARNYLRTRGYDVVEIGNYEHSSDISFVLDRVGDVSSAKKVAYALGIADSLVYTERDSSLFLRCSVVLGKDYAILRPFK